MNSQLVMPLLERLETILLTAMDSQQPLELEPSRSQLFEVFVTADAAGLTDEENGLLSPDELCRSMGARWELDVAAQQSVSQQTKLDPEDLQRLRLLWSLMRLWMEWSYAWKRWPEFHEESTAAIEEAP